jgi:hypothetical protein
MLPPPHPHLLSLVPPPASTSLVPDGRIQGRWTQKWPSKISCGLGSQRPRKRPNSKFPIFGLILTIICKIWTKNLLQKFFPALFHMIWGVAGLRPNFFSSGRIFWAELAQESWRDPAAVLHLPASLLLAETISGSGALAGVFPKMKGDPSVVTELVSHLMDQSRGKSPPERKGREMTSSDPAPSPCSLGVPDPGTPREQGNPGTFPLLGQEGASPSPLPSKYSCSYRQYTVVMLLFINLLCIECVYVVSYRTCKLTM